MGRPRKRARLALFPRSSTREAELEEARFHNDMSLKSRFEAIFQKYSQDFSGVGDEIEVTTGRVIVNNGHIQTMEHETDPGLAAPVQSQLRGPSAMNGRTFLRSMTVAEESRATSLANVEDDDIVESIEMIAENASMSTRYISGTDSEDDLLGRLSRQHSQDSGSDDLLLGRKDHALGARSPSFDSLFGEQETSASTQFPRHSKSLSTSSYPSTRGLSSARALSDDAILDRFGPQIGQEVLQEMHRRYAARQSHIERVWQVPDFGDPFSKPAISTPAHESLVEQLPPSQSRYLVQEQRPQSNRTLLRRSTSTESLDPFQEDFVDMKHAASSEEEADGENLEDDDSFVTDDLKEEMCLFCHKQTAGTVELHQHWADIVWRPRLDNVHDIDFITQQLHHHNPQVMPSTLTTSYSTPSAGLMMRRGSDGDIGIKVEESVDG